VIRLLIVHNPELEIGEDLITYSLNPKTEVLRAHSGCLQTFVEQMIKVRSLFYQVTAFTWPPLTPDAFTSDLHRCFLETIFTSASIISLWYLRTVHYLSDKRHFPSKQRIDLLTGSLMEWLKASVLRSDG
jgi:hypothetical protein